VYVEKVIAPQIKNGHGERIRSMAWDLCFDLDHIVGGPPMVPDDFAKLRAAAG
jgi:hypothetical protein